MGAEEWRYAGSLEKVTAEMKPLLLNSSGNPTQILNSGMLQPQDSKRALGQPDHFIYDPRDVSTAELESRIDPSDLTDQRMLFAQEGAELVYHSEPFEKSTEVSGFFRLSAWIALDQPDTDLQAQIFEITANGRSILLTTDRIRARYRESLRVAALVTTHKPLLYEFKRFISSRGNWPRGAGCGWWSVLSIRSTRKRITIPGKRCRTRAWPMRGR